VPCAQIERMRAQVLGACDRRKPTPTVDGRRFLPSHVSIHRTLRVRKMGLRQYAATEVARGPNDSSSASQGRYEVSS
jgi:hypothetical protein